ncbi:hypothetical protein [Alteromonas sp. LTR]|uniref:hypothetical protein n=2 Tax=unclassified Alteromonas TaxID=2614992 RepID=UPI00050986A0|nr:hypothetical protein [Alteromonas sp. LTR]
MKYLLYGIVLYCALSLNAVKAVEVTEVLIEPENYKATGFGNVTPLTYLVNQKGEAVFKQAGVARDLARHFTNTKPIDSSDNDLAMLSKQLPDDYDFSDYDYTLFIVRAQKDEHCPPCKKQNSINEKVMERLNELRVHYVKILEKPADSVTVTIVSEEEYNRLTGRGN